MTRLIHWQCNVQDPDFEKVLYTKNNDMDYITEYFDMYPRPGILGKYTSAVAVET